MFRAALPSIAKTWEKLKYPSKGKQINQCGIYIYTYIHIYIYNGLLCGMKTKEILTPVTTGMNLEDIY